jgi:tetratricopeptide (TPR) repeat protein
LSEKDLGAWLVVNACQLMPLTEAGLSLESLLDVYPVILKVVRKMPKMTRRRLMQLATAAFVVGDIPILSEKYVSAEEKTELCGTLGESIAASWKLFHTAGNTQVLMVGQALLCLVEQNHSVLPHRDRALFYSAIYDLIGKSYFFQERYEEALNAHQSAYIAALQAGDPWRITQSLICQADGYQARGQHVEAIQTIEEASRVLGTPCNEEQLRSKAHLLACWADNAMNLGEDTTVQRQLEASAVYLDRLGPNEEFDRAIWLQLAGKYALKSGDYMTALRHYEEAQAELPAHWIVRQVLVLLPMMVAYACKRDRDASLATAKKAAAALHVLNAPGLNKQFAESVRRGLLDSFPKDEYVQAFLTDAQQRYPLLPMATGLE